MLSLNPKRIACLTCPKVSPTASCEHERPGLVEDLRQRSAELAALAELGFPQASDSQVNAGLNLLQSALDFLKGEMQTLSDRYVNIEKEHKDGIDNEKL